MERSKGEIIIDEQYCKGCAYCLEFCPKDCITKGDKFSAQGYQIPVFENKENCSACMICAKMCPESAIEVYKYI
ncbi:MAG: ferredoxin family protein [Thermodesulfobacteriota bacterium]|nr:ferredoxin family protein [Thermodesulfobacteriota bacterium]